MADASIVQPSLPARLLLPAQVLKVLDTPSLLEDVGGPGRPGNVALGAPSQAHGVYQNCAC